MYEISKYIINLGFCEGAYVLLDNAILNVTTNGFSVIIVSENHDTNVKNDVSKVKLNQNDIFIKIIKKDRDDKKEEDVFITNNINKEEYN